MTRRLRLAVVLGSAGAILASLSGSRQMLYAEQFSVARQMLYAEQFSVARQVLYAEELLVAQQPARAQDPARAQELPRSQEVVVELDPAQTQIDFTLGATLHTVHGSFKLKRGLIRYDTSTGKASGEIVVDATSGISGNDSRDRKMHAEFLESQKYPEITFIPDSVQGPAGIPGPAGTLKTTAPQKESPRNESPRNESPRNESPRNESQVQFHGLFKLHGSVHEMTLTAQVQIIDGRPSATIHFVVPYVQWGLKNPSTFILRVSDKVDIDIHTAAQAPLPLSK